MEVHFTIGSGVIGGALLGAIVSICFIGFFSFIGAGFEAFMSLGGSGEFWGKLAQGAKIYVPVGLIVGAVTGSLLSAWMAIPMTMGAFFILMRIQTGINKSRRWR
jgi:hypothetical protein